MRRDSDLIQAAADRAAKRFAWYRKLLTNAGEPPILTDDRLATTYYAETLPAGQAVFRTSGTSGAEPKLVGWPDTDHERYVRARVELFGALMGDECRTACSDLGTGHAQASAREIFDALGLDSFDLDVTLPVERHVAQLRQHRPDLLYTMPVILERIVSAGGPGYVPKWIVVLGDVAPRAWRDALAQRLGMARGRIVDVFGSIEVGAIGYSDDAHDRYLFHEHIIPEALDAADADGGQRISLTSLERDGFPAVRYACGDVVRGLHSVTVGGRRRWAYEAHLGRSGNEIKHGEMLSLPLIAACLADVAPGAEWAVRRNGLEVVIELDERAYSASVAERIGTSVAAAHPAVAAMIASGLVADIGVEPRSFETPRPGAKRSIA